MRDATNSALRDLLKAQKVPFLLDVTRGLINLAQNDIIKLFSVLAVIFMPPTVIASIYGMNFKAMPDLEWPLGYPMALAMMGPGRDRALCVFPLEEMAVARANPSAHCGSR